MFFLIAKSIIIRLRVLLQLSLISIIQKMQMINPLFDFVAVIQTKNTMNYFIILVLDIFSNKQNNFFSKHKHNHNTRQKFRSN